MLSGGLGTAKRTVVSGTSIAPTCPFVGLPHTLAPTPVAARVGDSHSGAPAAMLSSTRWEFSLPFCAFCIWRSVWESGSLKAGVPVGTCWSGSHSESQRHARLIALSPRFSVRNPGLYLLSDHLFCFAADRATMKRPQSSLFCTRASAGYVDAGQHLPLVRAPSPNSQHSTANIHA